MLSTLIIASALAVAPAAEARKSRFAAYKAKYSDRFDLPEAPPNTPGGIRRKPRKTRVSTSKCLAISSSKLFAASKSVHKTAVAEAWKYACSSDVKGPGWWKEIHNVVVDADKKSGKAFAFAKAISTAAGACDTKGNAYGCAAAWSFSQAWAEATAEVNAIAWAEAINECDCNDKIQAAAANGDSEAWDSETLYASVASVAEAHVCVADGQKDIDTDAQTCIQGVYATVLAKAVAIAAIEGECLDKAYYGGEAEYSEYTAAAFTAASAKIVIDEVEGCVPEALDGYKF